MIQNNKTDRHLLREDMQIIYDMIQPKTRVLDLGCGDGTLLSKLINEKKVRGQGVERDPGSVAACIEKGVPVIQADLDLGLYAFASQSYDYVVLSQTMQLLKKPDELLKEMLSVGHIGIVSIFNFGFWLYRIHLFFTGRLPQRQSGLSPFYHNTNNY